MAEMAVGDFESNFKDTIVMFEHEIVHVLRVSENRKVLLKRIRDGETIQSKSFMKEDYSVKDLRLGYINHDGYASYQYRSPLRVFKAGICRNNTNMTRIRGDGRLVPDNAILSTVEAYKMFMAEYPTFGEALRHVKDFGGSCAFDKQFCIDERRVIYYKTEEVGNLPRFCTKARNIVLRPEYGHLKELLNFE